MKKNIMMAVLATSIAFSACAQKLKDADVPAAVKTSFATAFPGSTAKWEKEDGKYEAGFKKGSNSMSALFEANGTMTESEESIKVAELPAGAATYIVQNYKGKKIKETAKITAADGTVTYEAEVDGKDLIFDTTGKFLKAVKD